MPAPKNNTNAVGNQGGGRPSKYKPEYAEQAKSYCSLGATDRQLASFFDVAEPTIRDWRVRHVEFSAACKLGKDAADDAIERATYQGILGDTKIVNGKEVYYPPNPTAGLRWLALRRRDEWQEQPKGGGDQIVAEGLKAALLEMTQKSREARAERRRLAKETSH